jgi:hypothetical protein
VSGHAKLPPASHQASATSLKLLIQQIHPHVRVEREKLAQIGKYSAIFAVIYANAPKL